jgi:hypothetical protein
MMDVRLLVNAIPKLQIQLGWMAIPAKFALLLVRWRLQAAPLTTLLLTLLLNQKLVIGVGAAIQHHHTVTILLQEV